MLAMDWMWFSAAKSKGLQSTAKVESDGDRCPGKRDAVQPASENKGVLWLAVRVIQKTFDVGIIPGGFVELLLIDDNSLEKSFFNKSMKAAHYKKIFEFLIDRFVCLLGTAGTNAVDHFEQF